MNDSISFSERIHDYSQTGKNPDKDKYVKAISEALVNSDCPLNIRQIIEAQLNNNEKNGEAVRIKIFLSSLFGGSASFISKSSRIAGSIFGLPYNLIKASAIKTLYGIDDEIDHVWKKQTENWIDLGGSLISIPVTWVAFWQPNFLKNKYVAVQDYYISRLDRDEERKFELKRQVHLFEFNLDQRKKEQDINYDIDMAQIKLEETQKEEWKSQQLIKED